MAFFNWLGKYWGGLLLAAFAVCWFWLAHEGNLMHERAHHTIGYLTGWHPTPKSGIYYEFNFKVAGTTYESSGPGKVKLPIVAGTRFVVKYDSLDPASNVGYFEVSVPDTVRRAPPAGWRRPTFPLPQRVLDMGKE